MKCCKDFFLQHNIYNDLPKISKRPDKIADAFKQCPVADFAVTSAIYTSACRRPVGAAATPAIIPKMQMIKSDCVTG